MQMNYRRARLSELPDAAEFWLAMFREIGHDGLPSFRADWRTAFVRYFERRISAGEAAYFVAEDAGTLAGAAGAILRDGYPIEIHGVAHGYILGVYVQPRYRGHGAATKLTQMAVEFLRERNVANIRLHASPFGRNIYERLGFVDTNEMKLDFPWR